MKRRDGDQRLSKASNNTTNECKQRQVIKKLTCDETNIRCYQREWVKRKVVRDERSDDGKEKVSVGKHSLRSV